MVGELATFNTATGATTTKDVDSLPISATDFGTKVAKTLNDELGLLGHACKLAVKEWKWATDNSVLKIASERLDSSSRTA